MLSTIELYFLRGVVSDSEFPYYLIYQEPQTTGQYDYRTVHVYLSKDPVEISGFDFSVSADSVYYTISQDQYFSSVSSGSSSGTLPSDAACYTSTPGTPLFPDLLESSLEVKREVSYNFQLLFFVILSGCLVGGLIRSILFGGP